MAKLFLIIIIASLPQVGFALGNQSASFVIDGVYSLDQDGDLSFIPNARSARFLPHLEKSATQIIGFSNQNFAIKRLKLEAFVAQIDLVKKCGIHGDAKIRIAEFISGPGPTREWHTAKFVTALTFKKPHVESCMTSRSEK